MAKNPVSITDGKPADDQQTAPTDTAATVGGALADLAAELGVELEAVFAYSIERRTIVTVDGRKVTGAA